MQIQDVGILSKTTSFRKNSWELNHSRVSSTVTPKTVYSTAHYYGGSHTSVAVLKEEKRPGQPLLMHARENMGIHIPLYTFHDS